MSIAGVSGYSVLALGPNINKFRPKVSDLPKLMEDIKLTSADISSQVAQEFIPDYGIKDLAPPIPQNNTRFQYQPLHVQTTSTDLPSTTAMLVNRAKAIKAYGSAA